MKTKSKVKSACILLLLCTGILTMSGCSMGMGRETLENDVLRVGMHLDIDKMCYLSQEDNQPEGFEVELAGLLADKMLSSVGLSQWNTIHYGHTQPYLDLSSIEKGSGDEEDTRIAAFTKKGNSLADTLEEYLEELKEDGSLSQLSTKYFGEDLTI